MPNFFHLHLVSDATGETLNLVSRAAVAYYPGYRPIEHLYALVRSTKDLARAEQAIEAQPGIVLYTIADDNLRDHLIATCHRLSLPCISVIDPVINAFASYLGATSTPQAGAQHALDAEYFRRIEALNFTMAHDDGHQPQDLESADIIILGVSRSSKTPTSIYLANRGYRTANIPYIPSIALPDELSRCNGPLIVGLTASAERITQVRRNRLISLKHTPDDGYADRAQIARELAGLTRLCHRHHWPIIDVTRRSIEETAAEIINLAHQRQQQPS